jgi:two-component system, cell cycle sensor histidine kinase and response regulator CckA
MELHDANGHLRWRMLVLIAGVYLVVMLLSLRGILESAQVAVFWPPSGLLLGLLLVLPRRSWLATLIAIGIAGTIANMTVGRPLLISLGFTFADLAEPLIGASIVRLIAGEIAIRFDRVRQVVALTAATIIGAFCSAALAEATNAFAQAVGVKFPVAPGDLWQTWAAGAVMGSMIFAPATIALCQRLTMQEQPGWRRPARRIEALTLVLIATAVTGTLFMGDREIVRGLGPLLYVMFPVSAWAALRCGLLTVGTICVIVSVLAFACTLDGRGPIAAVSGGGEIRWIWLQFWLIAVVLTSLTLAALARGLGETMASLNEAEERYKGLVTAMPVPMLVHDGARFLMLNPAACSLLGVKSVDELKDTSPDDIVVRDEPGRGHVELASSPTGVIPLSPHAERWRRRDGTIIEVEIAASVCRFEGARVMQIIANDVTEQRRTEAALSEQRSRLESTVGSIADVVWSTRPELNKLIYFSPAADRVYGRPAQDFLDDSDLWYKVIIDEDRDRAIKAFENPELVDHIDVEYRIRLPDGKLKWVRDRARPVRDSTGKVIRLDGTVTDITEQKLALAERLREQDLFGAGPVMAWRWRRAQGWPVEAVSSNISQFGYASEDFTTGRIPYASIVHPDDLARVANEVEDYTKQGVDRFEQRYRVRRADGEYRFIHDITVLVRGVDGQVTHYEGFIIDRTDELRAEEARRESEERFRQLAEYIDDVFWVFDVDSNRLVYVGPSFERLFGVRVEAILGDVRVWYKSVHPDDSEEFESLVGEFLADESQRDFETEYRIIRPDGATRWLRNRAFKIRSEGPPRIVGITEDVTESHRADEERRRLSEQIQQLERLESIGRLAGGVAHDVNNLLMPIITYNELAMADLPADHPARSHLSHVAEAAAAASTLSRQLLAFGKRQHIRASSLSFNDTVATWGQMIRGLLGSGIKVTTDLGPGVGMVAGDESQLHRVFMNLCFNARDAMPRGGTLTIRTSRSVDAGGRGRAVLEVVDTGVGMDEQVRSRAFEPFFTTKALGQGTGLGLSNAYAIVRAHGGDIRIESTRGAGTRVIVSLPEERAATQATIPHGPPPRALRVLVVEDEDLVRGLLVRSLEQRGHSVLAVSSPIGALKLIETLSSVPDALVADVSLPEFTGLELRRRLRSRGGAWSTLATVLLSGAPADDEAEALQADPAQRTAFLAKPFAFPDLLDTLAAITDAPAGANTPEPQTPGRDIAESPTGTR